MRTKLINNLSKALWDSDLVATRIVLALSEMFWAVMLLWSGDTFTRPTYALMSKATNEEVWGVLFLVSSITQMSIVLMDDMYSRFARYFAGWNAALWTYVVTSMLISVQPPPAAIGGEIALALFAIWIWVRPNILAKGIQAVTEAEYKEYQEDYKESQSQINQIQKDMQNIADLNKGTT